MRILIVIGLTILLCLPIVSWGQVYGAWGLQAIEQPSNVVFVDASGELAAAVAAVPDGGTIFFWPGVYADSNITSTKAIFFAGMGPLGSARLTSDTILILGAGSRGTSFENLMIDCAQTGSWIRAGGINYSMRNCRVRAKVWNIGDNVTYFEHCQFEIGTYGGMYAGGTTGSSADTAWFVDCQWGYPLFVEPVWQYPLSAGVAAQNGIKVVDGAFAHTRYSRMYTDSTSMEVSANGGFAGGYFGIFYNGGTGGVDGTHDSTGATWTNNATSGGGSFMWSALENNDLINGTVQAGGSGSVFLLDPFIINKNAATALSYKSTSSVKSHLFGGHYMGSSTGGLTVMTIPEVDYPLHGWVDQSVAVNPFLIGGQLKVVADGPTVRNILAVQDGADTTYWLDADSSLYDGARDRGGY